MSWLTVEVGNMVDALKAQASRTSPYDRENTLEWRAALMLKELATEADKLQRAWEILVDDRSSLIERQEKIQKTLQKQLDIYAKENPAFDLLIDREVPGE